MIKQWLLFLALPLAGFAFVDGASAAWRCGKWQGDTYCEYLGGPGSGPPPP